MPTRSYQSASADSPFATGFSRWSEDRIPLSRLQPALDFGLQPLFCLAEADENFSQLTWHRACLRFWCAPARRVNPNDRRSLVWSRCKDRSFHWPPHVPGVCSRDHFPGACGERTSTLRLLRAEKPDPSASGTITPRPVATGPPRRGFTAQLNGAGKL
jgi:hypothetical protein